MNAKDPGEGATSRGVTDPDVNEVDVDNSTQVEACLKCGQAVESEFKARKPEALGFCRRCACQVMNAAYMARHREENREEVNAAQRAYKAAHPDRVVKYRRTWSAKHPELKRQRDKAFREAHRGELAAYFAAVYAKNPAAKREAARQWRLANPERYRELQQRRRSRVRGAAVGVVDVEALWTGLCGICGTELDATLRRPNLMSRSIDHILPLSRGGSHAQDNLQWTHLVCNLRKGSKILTAPAN